jgi:hypothetical protein
LSANVLSNVASQPPPLKTIELVAEDTKPCTCKNGKCAKKYCVCLKRAAKCNPQTCTCRDCVNLDSADAVMRRSEQLKKIEEGQFVRKGCNCKRNHCAQNYCVCFQQGLDCESGLCECSDCKNFGHFKSDRSAHSQKTRAVF